MAGFTDSLLTGLAQFLADEGLGVYRPGGVYSVGEVGIVIGALPPQPDKVICLAAYPLSSHARLADAKFGLQIKTRGGRNDAEAADLADATFELLNGAANLWWDGVRVVQVLHQTSTPLVRDGNDLWLATDNYHADVMRPTTHRTD